MTVGRGRENQLPCLLASKIEICRKDIKGNIFEFKLQFSKPYVVIENRLCAFW